MIIYFVENLKNSNLRSIPEPEHGNILAEVGVNFHFQQSGRFQNGLVVHRDLDGYLQVNTNQGNIRSLNASYHLILKVKWLHW